jgi:hypothetical protein
MATATGADRERLRAEHAEALDLLSAPIEEAVAEALARTLRAAFAAAQPALVAAGQEPVDLAALSSITARWDVETEGLAVRLADTFEVAGRSEWGRLAEAFASRQGDGALGDPETLLGDRARDFLAGARNRLVGVGDTSWSLARGALEEGLRQGEPIDELRLRVEDVLDVAEARARTIARTETHGAVNAGQAAAVRTLGPYGPDEKEWLATRDSRTRDTHWLADGQRVGLDEPFVVGGALLQYPGGPGPAREVINCRCTVLYHGPGALPEPEPEPAVPPPLPPADDGWPPGMKRARAQTWLQDRWGLDDEGRRRSFHLSGFGSDDAANEVGRTLHELLQRFPASGRGVRVAGASGQVTSALQAALPGRRIPGIGRATGDAQRDYGWLRINTARTKAADLAGLRSGLAEQVASGFSGRGTGTLAGVVRHEFGHHVKYLADRLHGRAQVDEAIEAVLRRFIPSGVPSFTDAYWQQRGRLISTGLSRYANTNNDELIAEAFAEAVGADQPRPVAVALYEAIVALAEGSLVA